MNAVKANRARKSVRLSLPATRWSVVISTFFYVGHLPVVRGNTHLGSLSASIVTPFIVWALVAYAGLDWITAGLGVAALATLVGTVALMDVEKRGVPADHDSRAVVIDEVAGAALGVMPLALAAPMVAAETLPLVLLAGFVFRVLDIAKPWPISAIDTKWHHPFSVIADDLLAGVGTAGFILLVLLSVA